MKKIILSSVLSAFLAISANAEMQEFPFGEEQVINHMRIAAVYLKPIDMEPRGIDRPASQSDIHLEADIHAEKGNPNGFGAGEWIPHLTIGYTITNLDTGKSASGKFMPMIAKDGPHYGANVKMLGMGNYKIKFDIENPEKQGFGRHTDKDTGVGKWFKPFSIEFTDTYKGIK